MSIVKEKLFYFVAGIAEPFDKNIFGGRSLCNRHNYSKARKNLYFCPHRFVEILKQMLLPDAQIAGPGSLPGIIKFK